MLLQDIFGGVDTSESEPVELFDRSRFMDQMRPIRGELDSCYGRNVRRLATDESMYPGDQATLTTSSGIRSSRSSVLARNNTKHCCAKW